MKYSWTRCPGCGCEVAINYTEGPERVSGSLRRWSSDRTVNDGRSFSIPATELPPGGGFPISCVCGQDLRVPAIPDAVGAEREENLRVKLGE
jgi:hypothetical protein